MQLRELSTTGFAIAVAEEFIIISGVSVYAVLSQHYFLWMALFLAFGIHLLVHVGQFVLLRKYIPAIVTSLLCLPYAVYVCYFFYSTGLFTAMDFLLGGILIDQDALIPPTGLRIILCHPSLRISTK